MSSKRVLMLSLVTLAAIVFVGCAPTMVGTNMGVYKGGKMYSVSDKDMDAVYEATLSAMDKLQLEVTDKAKDVFAAKVVAESADGQKVVVKIKPLEDKTQYTIQVGSLGNKERSEMLFTEIKNSLTGM